MVAETGGCSSPPSGEVSVFSAPLPAEDLEITTLASGSLTFSWTDENRYDGSTTGVETSPRALEAWSAVACLPAGPTSCTLPVEDDVRLDVRVTLTRGGEASSSAPLEVHTLPKPTVITETTASDDSITVTFTART